MLKTSRLLPALVALLLTTSACASGAYYSHQERYPSGARVSSDRAYRTGFEQGRARGEEDARLGVRFDYSRHRDYRSADAGYVNDGGYGNRNAYREVFREGFRSGYEQGFRRLSRR